MVWQLFASGILFKSVDDVHVSYRALTSVIYLPMVVSLGSQLERGYIDRPAKVDPAPQLRTSQLNTIRPLKYIMSLKLRHDDYVDDTGPCCPVCFNLNYENLESDRSQQGGRRPSKAGRALRLKGLLRGFHIWWLERYDFQYRAEKYRCIFCAVLLQVIDRFWRRPQPRKSSRLELYFRLMVFENGSVELEDFESVVHYRPTRLMLFTPSGTENLSKQLESINRRRAVFASWYKTTTDT